MKKFVTTTVLALGISTGTLAVSNFALASGTATKYTSTLQAPAQGTPIRVQVSLGENLAYRAENLSKNIRDRRASRSLNNGFANNGYFGQKDLDKLTERLKARTEARLAKNGIPTNDTASTVLKIVLTDARPNSPTFLQLSKSPSLSARSFGTGGASMEATLVNGSGDLGTVKYGWFETDIEDSRYGGTWSDARRAIDRFARKTAKSLK